MTRTLLASATLVVLLLAGCTSDFLVDGAGPSAAPTPTPSDTATPTPSAVPTEDPAEFDCDNILINHPGNYVLGECGTITLEGSGIDLTLTSVANLVIRGDNADVLATTIGDLEISGQGNEITVDEDIDTVHVEGNENVVTAGGGIGSIRDDGLLNEIS